MSDADRYDATAEWVEDRRRRVFASRAAAARAAGVSDTTWRKLEMTGGAGMSPAKLAAMAAALGWAPDTISDMLAGRVEHPTLAGDVPMLEAIQDKIGRLPRSYLVLLDALLNVWLREDDGD